ncbi:MAG: hypothetical protein ACR2MM_02725, partial [Flavobacteriaceae bacterium]
PEGIAGEWQLVEMLADPGDGSGVFSPVDSDKMISILSDGTYSSNGNLCAFSAMLGDPSSGVYDEEANGYLIDCGSPFPSQLRLNLVEGDLIISFFCIEPCLQKFKRID